MSLLLINLPFTNPVTYLSGNVVVSHAIRTYAMGEDEDQNSYTIYEVDVVDDPPAGCTILENDNIVVTLEADKIKLSNWSDAQAQGLSTVDWIKRGEVDIIRCGKFQTKIFQTQFTHHISSI